SREESKIASTSSPRTSSRVPWWAEKTSPARLTKRRVSSAAASSPRWSVNRVYPRRSAIRNVRTPDGGCRPLPVVPAIGTPSEQPAAHYGGTISATPADPPQPLGSRIGDKADVPGQPNGHLAGLVLDVPLLEERASALQRLPLGQRVEGRSVLRVPGSMEPAPVLPGAGPHLRGD